ncbi:hypothetical protein NC651_037936 [Populus alba x Populus x berolinensis]|nr:hypothetical protein NC651_037936 [Populus alba x Populus x berolinensis]
MLSFAVQCNRYIAKTLYGDDEEEETPQDTNDTNVDETKLLDVHPTSDEKVLLKKGPYGFYVQLGEDRTGCTLKRSSVSHCCMCIVHFLVSFLRGKFSDVICHAALHQHIVVIIKDVDAIALEVALDLLRYPWTLGDHPKYGNPVILKLGRVGYMVKTSPNNGFCSQEVTPNGLGPSYVGNPKGISMVVNYTFKMLFETLPEDVALEKALELLLGKNADRSGQPKSKPKVKEAVEARESGVGQSGCRFHNIQQKILESCCVMEPILGGNLPPAFDPSSSCRRVYVGNIHVNVTDKLLAEVFATAGPLAGCKLIRKDKSSYGFVDYHDQSSAALAIMTLHGRQLYGQALKVNWAYGNSQREDTSGHFHVFVGDLSPEVTDANLFACFSVFPSCSNARVMWDHKTGRSKGYGFVSFRNQQEAQSAINDLTGKWLGNRQIRCNWATKGVESNEDKQNSDNQNAVVLANGSSEGGQESTNEEAPENNPAYTTVYVGNLSHEVTQAELHRHFHALGAGVIEDVRVQRDKGFGFVRYNTHEEAASAIQTGNGKIVCGKPVKCSWGSKPTPPGTASNPLPPPPPPQPYQIAPSTGINQGYSAADLLAYQSQLALSQAAASGLSGQALLQLTGQHGLAAASMDLSAGGSQAMYDGYHNGLAAQQLMYYR